MCTLNLLERVGSVKKSQFVANPIPTNLISDMFLKKKERWDVFAAAAQLCCTKPPPIYLKRKDNMHRLRADDRLIVHKNAT